MPPRILIAEDDDLQGSLLRMALQGRGYQADIVTDGLEAVRRLRTGHYDLALLDYHMPEVDGRAAATLLHDFLPQADRPRLIAVTAAAQGLSAREGAAGVAAFDAIVSKQVGLPALLAVVDDNLTDLAELQIALQAERARDVLREEQARRRQRMRALLGAAPGLVMAGVFGAGLLWASASLKHVDAAIGAARQTTALSAGTTALIGAMANAEMSQRSYLATGGAADRQAFNNDITQVDRLLVAPGSLVADGAAGFDPAHGPLPMIEGRLQALSEQVASHHPTPMRPGPETNSAMAGRDLAEALRIWASDLVTASQTAVLTGLAALQDNIRLVLAVLSAGLLYGLWTSARSWQRLRNSASATPQAQALRVRSHRSRPRRLLLGDAGA